MRKLARQNAAKPGLIKMSRVTLINASQFCFGLACAPKGQPQISPGQGNASPASVAAALGERFHREDEAGKAVAGFASHRLPVVAMGSIPHIYRREGHSPGDPN